MNTVVYDSLSMGVTLTQYRSTIGLFGGGNMMVCWICTEKANGFQKGYIDGDWVYFKQSRVRVLPVRLKLAKSGLNTARLIFGLLVLMHDLLILCGDIKENPGPVYKKDISICHVNVRSLRSTGDKLPHIKAELADKYDVITVSETWLNSSVCFSQPSLPGYQTPFKEGSL